MSFVGAKLDILQWDGLLLLNVELCSLESLFLHIFRALVIQYLNGIVLLFLVTDQYHLLQGLRAELFHWGRIGENLRDFRLLVHLLGAA